MADYAAFLSYDPTDAAWVEGWLLPRLQNAGLKIATADDFVLGRSRLVNVEHMVDDSQHTLCVLSPAWLNNEWSVFDALLSQTADPGGMIQRTIPLRRQPCELPRRIAMLEAADFTGSDDRWDRQLRRVLSALGIAAQPSLPTVPIPEPSPTQPGTAEYYREAQERILVYLASQVDRDDVPRDSIGLAVNLDFQLVEDLLEVLEHKGTVEVDRYLSGVAAKITQQGLFKVVEIEQRRTVEAEEKWEHIAPEQGQRAVLQTIHQIQRQSPHTYVNDTKVAEVLSMALEMVRDYMDLLEQNGYTQSANAHDGHSAMLTGRGRIWLRAS
jgi:predicted transcriptional regulator